MGLILVHAIKHFIESEKEKVINFLRAFTDAVSAFPGKSKKDTWHAWDVYPEASAELSMASPVVGNEEKNVLERFVIIIYGRSSSATVTDSVRLDMFARKQKSYDAIHPTSEALEYYTKRAAYQAYASGGSSICPPNGCTEPL